MQGMIEAGNMKYTRGMRFIRQEEVDSKGKELQSHPGVKLLVTYRYSNSGGGGKSRDEQLRGLSRCGERLGSEGVRDGGCSQAEVGGSSRLEDEEEEEDGPFEIRFKDRFCD